jgi:hypothetical protein
MVTDLTKRFENPRRRQTLARSLAFVGLKTRQSQFPADRLDRLAMNKIRATDFAILSTTNIPSLA